MLIVTQPVGEKFLQRKEERLIRGEFLSPHSSCVCRPPLHVSLPFCPTIHSYTSDIIQVGPTGADMRCRSGYISSVSGRDSVFPPLYYRHHNETPSATDRTSLMPIDGIHNLWSVCDKKTLPIRNLLMLETYVAPLSQKNFASSNIFWRIIRMEFGD